MKMSGRNHSEIIVASDGKNGFRASSSRYSSGPGESHNLAIGYVLWIFGFMGAHRFYFGKQISGLIYFFTFGLLGIGWLVDLFLIPGMDREADLKYKPGHVDYTIAWVLLTFLGVLGVHRFYMGKVISGLIYFFTGGIFLFGYLYDFLTLNGQIDEIHRGIKKVF